MIKDDTEKQLELVIAMKSMADRKIDAQIFIWSDIKGLCSIDYTMKAKHYADAYLKWLEAVDAMGDKYPEGSDNRYLEVCRAVSSILRLIEMSFMCNKSGFENKHIRDIAITLKILNAILCYYIKLTLKYWNDLSEKEKNGTSVHNTLDSIVDGDLIKPFEYISKTIYGSRQFQEKPAVIIEVVNNIDKLLKDARECLLAKSGEEGIKNDSI
ncbi:MAG: hypothetical protein LBN34_07205 [Clostridiales Family XIII bacterium]|jgi:hypothetical protein|nr:hypothetical protein [Clostridiales Family XIII bacterium]